MYSPSTSPKQQAPPEPPTWFDELEELMSIDSHHYRHKSEEIPAGEMDSHRLSTFDIISTLIHK